MADDSISVALSAMKGKRMARPFRLMACSSDSRAIFMVQEKNADIVAYKSIAKQAWDMESKLWWAIKERHGTLREHGSLFVYMKFVERHLPRVKIMCGRYRWMAWCSLKGIRAKRTILKMHARDKTNEEWKAVKRIMSILNSSSSWQRRRQ